MPRRYTIGELARATAFPISTLRYYERIALLCPTERSASNYRLYHHEAVEQLQFIQAAQATGFTLADIRTLLDLREGNTAPCSQVQTIIETRLDDVAQRMKDLRGVQRVLQSSLALCREAEASGRCQVMDSLGASKSRSGKKSRKKA